MLDLLLQVVAQRLVATMSSSKQQRNTSISDLPIELRRQIAALVEHGSLPALRLVSRSWSEAANLAVRQLKWYSHMEPAHLDRVRLIGQRWPNLEQLDLDRHMTPNEHCGDLMSSFSRLQHLSLATGAALLPEGQEFIFGQTRLLSLCLIGIVSVIGAPDGLLQAIGRLSHLTRLECELHSRYEQLTGMLTPIRLERATDEGVRWLSSLQSLQDLTLRFNSHYPAVTGQALSSIGSLHQLTHLSLSGWHMMDADLVYLTHLQLLSLHLDYCPYLTPGCLVHICLITSLHSLSMVESGSWLSEEELGEFEELAHEKMPFLTTLNTC